MWFFSLLSTLILLFREWYSLNYCKMVKIYFGQGTRFIGDRLELLANFAVIRGGQAQLIDSVADRAGRMYRSENTYVES